MNRRTRQSLARITAASAAVVVACCIGFLLTDHLATLYLSRLDKNVVESLEGQVKMDAQAALRLTSERERQTKGSVARDSVNEIVGMLLIAGSAAFLIGMNWLQSFQVQKAPALNQLVTLQTGPRPLAEAGLAESGSRDLPGMPELDLAFVDQTVAEHGRGREAAIPILRSIQLHCGYLPDEALRRVCELTEITPAQIAGTSSFYAQFRHSPVGKHIVKMCHGTACHVSGVVQVNEELRRYLAIPPDADTDPSRLFTLDEVACLGCCSLAPVMMVDEQTVGRLTPHSACTAVRALEPEGFS
jgi:NADH:ubiquinone oxidoreductase subunit E